MAESCYVFCFKVLHNLRVQTSGVIIDKVMGIENSHQLT